MFWLLSFFWWILLYPSIWNFLLIFYIKWLSVAWVIYPKAKHLSVCHLHEWDLTLYTEQGRLCVWQMVSTTHTHPNTPTRAYTPTHPPHTRGWIPQGHIIGPVVVLEESTFCLVRRSSDKRLSAPGPARPGQLLVPLKLHLHFYWHSSAGADDSETPHCSIGLDFVLKQMFYSWLRTPNSQTANSVYVHPYPTSSVKLQPVINEAIFNSY